MGKILGPRVAATAGWHCTVLDCSGKAGAATPLWGGRKSSGLAKLRKRRGAALPAAVHDAVLPPATHAIFLRPQNYSNRSEKPKAELNSNFEVQCCGQIAGGGSRERRGGNAALAFILEPADVYIAQFGLKRSRGFVCQSRGQCWLWIPAGKLE